MTDLSRSHILTSLGTSPDGLHDAEVLAARTQHGWNEIPMKKPSLLALFLSQFKSTMVMILLGAVVVSLAMPYLTSHTEGNETLNAFIILAIVILNAAFGFAQEWRAGNAIASLRKLSGPEARVRRNGTVSMIAARELVPGDLVQLEAGDRISADAVLTVASSLDIDESSLTGESVPVSKKAEERVSTSDRSFLPSMVYAGTLVTRGFGEAVVSETGLKTQIGHITSMVMQSESPETPLQRDLRIVGHRIGLVVLGLSVFIFIVGLLLNRDPIEMFFVAISLAVAAVPEGLPAVVTICLAIGVTRMSKRNALVRKLDAVETLGSVTVIAADKTGTMTENRMTATNVWTIPGVTEEELLQAAASCSRAELPDIGDPTEIALLRAAGDRGISRIAIDEEEVPFTSEEKYMVTVHTANGVKVRYAKGAVEVMMRVAKSSDPLITETNANYTSEGLRVLGVAADTGSGMRLLGLIAMMDPPRAEVRVAIEKAESAGIRTFMITGDHPATAYSIADRVGLTSDGVLTGADLDRLSDAELTQKLETVSVFARVRPEHKVRILSLLQKNGHIAAMTGDGVNDAPALRQAHVGVAMGKVGTDTARESSSIVLTDDNYATIVSAVEEGRRIYDNIRRFILFLMRSNVGEVLTVACSMLLLLPLPLLPLHILWVNLVTDSLPALALAMEPGSPHLMKRKPRSSSSGIFTGEWSLLLLAGAFNAVLCLVLFISALHAHADLTTARTVALTALILFQFCLAYSVRTRRFSLLEHPFANPWLIVSILFSVGLHAALLASPFAAVMHLTFLPFSQWLTITLWTLVTFLVFECCKVLFYRLRSSHDIRLGLTSF